MCNIKLLILLELCRLYPDLELGLATRLIEQVSARWVNEHLVVEADWY